MLTISGRDISKPKCNWLRSFVNNVSDIKQQCSECDIMVIHLYTLVVEGKWFHRNLPNLTTSTMTCLPRHHGHLVPYLQLWHPHLVTIWIWKSEMTQNYRVIVERCPKPNVVVGKSIPDHEIFSRLDKKLAKWPCIFCVPKKKTLWIRTQDLPSATTLSP